MEATLFPPGAIGREVNGSGARYIVDLYHLGDDGEFRDIPRPPPILARRAINDVE